MDREEKMNREEILEMELKHLSEEEKRRFKEKFPEGDDPKDWAIIDSELPGEPSGEEIAGVIQFFETEKEAKEALEEWRVLDLVENALRECVHKIADEVGIDVEKVSEIARGFF
ncbi:unnamed protein product [marine sediment metagenome]|uniref:Uncharacterized protein n=1 Tax=marine sediment metagenome TaxID=412755 RepID=X1G5I4_9ZZZZ